jgi:hypothetical protein
MRQWYERWKKHTVHPNLRVDYFQTIDTKENAYWLGFLYADGFLTRNKSGTIYIRLELSRNDEDIIDKFCQCLGLEKSKKEYRRHEETDSVEMRFACRKMVYDLFRHGLTFRKSKTLELPPLPNREVELAFLLGYYDGDGKQNSTEVASGSLRFLEQVKGRFRLPYRIQVERSEKKIYGRKIKEGTEYRLWLGVGLFKEMLENYTDSMDRKRRPWTERNH